MFLYLTWHWTPVWSNTLLPLVFIFSFNSLWRIQYFSLLFSLLSLPSCIPHTPTTYTNESMVHKTFPLWKITAGLKLLYFSAFLKKHSMEKKNWEGNFTVEKSPVDCCFSQVVKVNVQNNVASSQVLTPRWPRKEGTIAVPNRAIAVQPVLHQLCNVPNDTIGHLRIPLKTK